MISKIKKKDLDKCLSIVIDYDVGSTTRIGDLETIKDIVKLLKDNDLIDEMPGDEIFWIDGSRKTYKALDVEWAHLMNIVNFMERGGGYLDFLTIEKIEDILTEAKRRGIKVHKTAKEIRDLIVEKERKNDDYIHHEDWEDIFFMIHDDWGDKD